MSNYNRFYPAWCYSVREDITRANMDRYDREQSAITHKAEELNPDYHKLPLRDRMAARDAAARALGLE